MTQREAETITRLDNGQNLLSNVGEAPGLGFVALCRTCAEPAALDSGFGGDPRCTTRTKCARHRFRCSICCAAVHGHGACTWCPHCADTEDMWITYDVQWFREQKETVCPTGCGCECMLGNAGAQQTSLTF